MGRGGDTKLRNVDGELSHVNADEAAAIDMYGSVGENVVKAVGSGTINPNTGLKEYGRTWKPKEGKWGWLGQTKKSKRRDRKTKGE